MEFKADFKARRILDSQKSEASFLKFSLSGLNSGFSKCSLWLLIGFYILFLSIRVNSQSTNSTTIANPPTSNRHNNGVHLFIVDWENISDISIITLWIFSAAIAKIGKNDITMMEKSASKSAKIIINSLFILQGFI